jgi:transposase
MAPALARRLLAAGDDVCEVPAALSHREARRVSSNGKSDPTDAIAIARVVAREEHLPSPRRGAQLEDLKLLSDMRESAVQERTAVINRIHKHLGVLIPDYKTRFAAIASRRNQAKIMAALRSDRSVRADMVRWLITDLRHLDGRVAGLDDRLQSALELTGTSLTELTGIGPVVAARILGEIGDVSRLRSKAALARLAGIAPVPASSGQVTRHRHDRGGNRQLNCAIHLVAVNRCRSDPETRTYMTTRLRDGKTKKEALRALKRHLCNTIFKALITDLQR